MYDIKIITSPLIKNKDHALRYFSKNWRKMKVCKKFVNLSIEIDTLLIENNPDYRVWNPRKPFKWKNPRYIVYGMSYDTIRIKPFPEFNLDTNIWREMQVKSRDNNRENLEKFLEESKNIFD